ncbi:hypothetical protein [Microcoleus sp. Pol8_C1]|uniref:hypothetical protein n=1 Tax=Microcoleus sp. Pol8_C1 TaxID=2818896 RepID=UPI002FD6C220
MLRSQYPILQNYHLVDSHSIRCDRSLSFSGYCYAKTAIFVKGDRTLASCNLNRMRGRKPQNPFNNGGFGVFYFVLSDRAFRIFITFV